MSNPTEDKEAMVQALREWLEDPGNTHKLIFEVANGLNPQTRQPVRMFTLKGEAAFQKAIVPLDAPRVAPANGAMLESLPPPPGGMPPKTS